MYGFLFRTLADPQADTIMEKMTIPVKYLSENY